MTIETPQIHGSAALRWAVWAVSKRVTHDGRLRPFPLFVWSAARALTRDVDGHQLIDY
jgi:glutamate-1-semialdehyde aminotransferase